MKKSECYCNNTDSKILEDIKNVLVPDVALMKACCWQAIRKVKNDAIRDIKLESWDIIMQKRQEFFTGTSRAN